MPIPVLVVVALSLHAKAFMSHPLYRDRAFAAIVALMTQADGPTRG